MDPQERLPPRPREEEQTPTPTCAGKEPPAVGASAREGAPTFLSPLISHLTQGVTAWREPGPCNLLSPCTRAPHRQLWGVLRCLEYHVCWGWA